MPDRHRTRFQGPVTRLMSHVTGPTHKDYEVTLNYVTESMDDFVVPNFKERVNAGEIFVNPLSYVKDTFRTIGSGHYKWIRTNGWVYEDVGPGHTHLRLQHPDGHRMLGVPNAPEPNFDIYSAVKAKALGNVDRSPYSFAEDIAEFRETLKFLKKPWASVASLSKEFRKDVTKLRQRRHALRLADAIADVWLEYRFAFSPLVRSVNDGIAAHNDKVFRPVRRTARGSEKFSGTDSVHDIIVEWESEATVSIDRDVRAGILYEVTNPINDWRYKYGLRFKDIPETIWAVMPYSFMVDRVLNVSQAVRGLVSFLDPNVKILGAWTTERSTKMGTQSFLGLHTPAIQTELVNIPDIYARETYTYTRDVWEPSIGDVIPPERLTELVSTATKIADLATLIYSRIR